MTRILDRATPDPRCGSAVELCRRHTCRLFDFIGVRTTLSSEGIAAQKPPPAFLQVRPTGARRDQEVMQTPMLGHPGSGLSAAMAGEVSSHQQDFAGRMVGFDIL